MEARQRAMARLAAQLFDLSEDNSPEGLIYRRGVGGTARGSGGLSQENADRARIQLYLGQAIQLQSAGDDLGAVKPLEQALEIGLQTPDIYFDLGFILSTQDGQKSFRYLQESVKHPDYALGSYLLIAQLYEASDQFAEASLSYLNALRLADMELVSPEEAEELSQGYEPILEDQVNLTDLNAQKKLCEVIRGQLLRADWRQYLTMARQQLPLQPEGSPTVDPGQHDAGNQRQSDRGFHVTHSSAHRTRLTTAPRWKKLSMPCPTRPPTFPCTFRWVRSW